MISVDKRQEVINEKSYFELYLGKKKQKNNDPRFYALKKLTISIQITQGRIDVGFPESHIKEHKKQCKEIILKDINKTDMI